MSKLGNIWGVGPISYLANATIAKGIAQVLANASGVGAVTPAGAGVTIIGVAIEDGVAGEEVSVLQKGRFSECVAGAAVTAGAELEVDAAGKFITQTTGVIVGFAVESAGAADDTFAVDLI